MAASDETPKERKAESEIPHPQSSGDSSVDAVASAPQEDHTVADMSHDGVATGPRSDAIGPDQAPPKDSGKSAKESGGLWGFLRELLVLLLIGFIVVVFVRSFLVLAFYIPSGSMEKTLEINDRVLVNKQSYLFGDPQRGNIVVFRNWYDVGADVPGQSIGEYVVNAFREGLGLTEEGHQDLIKRVIGLPGETVQVKNSRVYINGRLLDEPDVYINGRDPLANFGPAKVPKGKYFVLGDHRNDSGDSRRVPGGLFVDKDAIVGRAFLRIWPFDRFGSLGKPPVFEGEAK